MKRINILLILSCLSSLSWGQSFLSIQEAIKLALNKNYSVQIAKNQATIDRNYATPGFAGMLPQILLNGSGNWANNDTKQKFSTGPDVDRKGAISTSINGGVLLNWTLFDGTRMFATYGRLRTIADMSITNMKIEMENTISDVLTTYYLIVKQKQIIRAIENTLSLYAERLTIAETKWKIGTASKLDFLQAQVDINEQKSNLLTQKKTLTDLKITFNQILARDISEEFDTDSIIATQYNPTYDELRSTTFERNNQIFFQQQNIRMNQYILRESYSNLFPRISLSSSYNFSQTKNQVGLILVNQNLGVNAGITATWSLFNGGNAIQQIKNSKLSILNAQLNFESAKKIIESSLLQTYNGFRNEQEILILEEQNFSIAKENVTIALERFKIGSSTSIELKEAQRSFEDAQVRLINARYSTKVSEINLMKLNGQLISDIGKTER